MIYNFDEIIDREGNRAAKYDERKKKFGREDVIPLWIADMDFKVARPIIDVLKYRAEEGIWGYTSRPASYFESICNWKKERNGWEIEKELIGFSLGVVQTLASAVKILTEKGDNVLIQTPVYSEFYDMVELSGRKVLENRLVPKEGEWHIDFLDFEEKAKNSKLFLLCNPHNPLGIVWSREELKRMIDICIENDVYVVSDEIYEHINFTEGGHVSIAGIDGMYDKTITVNGVSKAFAMTGWRIGYIGAPEWIAKGCTKLQGQVTSGANAIAQRAVITALEAPVSKIQFMIDKFHERRDLVLQLLGEIDGFNLNVPEGAFYVFPDISDFFGKTLNGVTINNASDFSLYLLEHANVATVTGEAFGNPNCIRISYAASEKELKEAIARIKAVL